MAQFRSLLTQIDRACFAIGVIARIVGNSASDPVLLVRRRWRVGSGCIGRGGILCDHAGALTDAMPDHARSLEPKVSGADLT